ncbi:MAG: hypothetical protein EA362_07580 [Saprospirales bacterium]|nr:MAG: hypothetical protein EA362_07580 [Saprospirales bacterium]
MKSIFTGIFLLGFCISISLDYLYATCLLTKTSAKVNLSEIISLESTDREEKFVDYSLQEDYLYISPEGKPNSSFSTCNEIISAGEGQVLCWPGGSTLLEGFFSSNEYLTLEWSPEEGLSDPNILQPIADVTSTTTYTLNIATISEENLIVNGDFELGNTGFSSDYIYNELSPGFLGQGEYSIQANPIVGNPGFSECGDHTSGSGNMFIADGALFAGTQVWCQTVTVLPDTDYFFQFFITSIFPVSPAEIETTFNGNSIGTISPTSNTCEWLEFSTVWNSGGLNEVTICMVNLNIVGYGNDFALDDISLRRICEYSDEVTITVLEEIRTEEEYLICAGESVEIGGQEFSEPGNYEVLLTNDFGCDSIIDLQIDWVPVFAFIEYPLTITCENEVVELDGSLSLGTEFQWSTTDGLILTDPSESIISVGAAGTYQLEVTNVENGVFCQDWVSVNVSVDTISPIFEIIIHEPLSCSDSVAILEALPVSIPPNAIIEWETQNGEIISGSNTLMPSVGSAGTYTLTISNPVNGCMSSHSIELESDTLKPVLELSDLLFITCRDSQVVLLAEVISPDTNFVFSWTTDGGNFVSGENTIEPTVDAPGLYSIIVTDTLSGCESRGSVRVEQDFFLPEIEVTSVDTFPCLEDSMTLSVVITPDSSIFQFSWTTPNGTILSGNETTNPIIGAEGDYQLVIENVNNGCKDSLWVEITEDCPCIASAGEFQIEELELCEGEDIELAALDLQSTIDDEDFKLFFVLHEGDANEIGNILAISQGDPIEWSSGFELGRAYFITAIISTSEEGEINFDDPCIDFSVGIPVVWVSGPNVEISGSIEICLGEDLFLTVESEGPFPFNIELNSSAGDTIDVEITEANQQVNLPQNAGETIWEINAVVSECDGIFSGEFIAIVSEPLELNFFTAPLICNNALFGSILDLNELIIGGTIDGTWIFDGEEVLDGVIDFDGFDPGQYEFFFSTEGFEDPCPGTSWLVLIDVIGCDCPPVSLPSALRICSDFDPIPLMELTGEAVEGVWTLNNPGMISPAPLIVDGFLVADLAVSGVFELVFTVTDSLPEECTSEYTVILEIEEFRSAGEVIASPVELCESESNEVNLFDYLTDFSEGGVWLDENREMIDEIVDLSANGLTSSTFYYLVEGEGLCSSDEVEVNIALLSSPEYEITTIDPACPGENSGSIIVENLDSDNPIRTVFLDGNAITEAGLSLLFAGTYTLELVGENGCSRPVEIVEITDPEGNFVDLGEDIEVSFSDEIVLNYETDLADSLTAEIIWSEAGVVLAEGVTDLGYTATTETTVGVALISIDGCLIRDEIRIILAEQGVYIPNVFRPGSDINVNSAFGPLGTEFISKVKQFSIFDRWGSRVHHVANVSHDQSGLFWNGKFRDESAPEGVYVYLLEYLDLGGRTHFKSGDFLLIR